MSENFKAYSQYYDLLYRDKSYEDEVKYVHSLVKKYASDAHSILDLGSGTGKHARILNDLGYIVHGIERSAEMVKIAEDIIAVNLSFQVGDISDFEVNDKFDVAVSLFHVISYLTTNAQLISTFKCVNESLGTGGIFIFDVWHSPAVYNEKPETRIKRISDNTIFVTRLAEPFLHFDSNVVDVHYEIIVEDKLLGSVAHLYEKHPMRHFSCPEIELLAIHTGFEIIKSEEFLTGHMPTNVTWGVCYILKKK